MGPKDSQSTGWSAAEEAVSYDWLVVAGMMMMMMNIHEAYSVCAKGFTHHLTSSVNLSGGFYIVDNSGVIASHCSITY